MKLNKYNPKIFKIIFFFLLGGVFVFLQSGEGLFAQEDQNEDDQNQEESLENSEDEDEMSEEEKQEVMKETEERFEREIDEKESEREELEDEKENYEKLAELKRQQQKTLRSQMELLDLQIEDMQQDVDTTEKQISQTKADIFQIKENIEEKHQNILKTKERLGEMIKVYHRMNQEIDLKMMSSGGSLTDILNQSDYLSQTSRKVKNSLNLIQEEKEELDQKKEELESKEDELSEELEKLEESRERLGSKKQEKQTLVTRTQNEEARYQSLVNKIESQMRNLLIDLESLSDEKKRKLRLIQEGAIDPTSGLSSTSWYYAQDEGSWANDYIAGSSFKMKDWGCAITSVAMVASYHGEKINPGDIAEEISFFNNSGEIIWGNPAKDLDLELTKNTAHSGVNWDEVDDYIEMGYPVIVFIRSGTGAGHYVVVHGYDEDHDDYVVHDPIAGTGPNSLLQTSKEYVSAIYNTSVNVDQMIVYKPE
ncbi:MAG: C39 family peptidase [Patescibacteria group bacterium]